MSYDVVSSRSLYGDGVFGFRVDNVAMPGGGVAERAVLEHPGAVVIAALTDADELVMVRQFRHPLRRYQWELPAGLLDVDGEPLVVGAQRELHEEAGIRASTWHTLLDTVASPGISDERVRIFLARGLSDVPEPERYAEHSDEEAELVVGRFALDEAVRMVFAGELENAATVAAVLAVAYQREHGWTGLRPVSE